MAVYKAEMIKIFVWAFIGVILFALFCGLFRQGAIMICKLIDAIGELRCGKDTTGES